MKPETRMDAVVELAHAGGREVMRYFRGDAGVRSKEAGNLVSKADLAAEEAILSRIRSWFPDEAIMSEESLAETQRAERLWIVDPLDGTNNFAHGLPYFAVSVAYWEGGQPMFGAVLNPVSDELFSASSGEGSFCNGRRLKVSAERSLDQCLVATGFYYDRGEPMRQTLAHIEQLFYAGIHGIRRFGAAALDLCTVASGSYGAFFEHHLSPWDFAAGRLIVEEAGGRVSDYVGNPLGVEASTVLATNGLLHEKMMRTLAEREPPRSRGC